MDGFAVLDWTGSVSTADGSALVRMGNTTIVCGVKAEIAEPELEKPNEGYLGLCPYFLFSCVHMRFTLT